MKCNTQKLLNVTNNELLDGFVRGLCLSIEKQILKEDPNIL